MNKATQEHTLIKTIVSFMIRTIDTDRNAITLSSYKVMHLNNAIYYH